MAEGSGSASSLRKILSHKLWKLRHRRVLRAAHLVALREAQAVYDAHRDQAVVLSHGVGPGYSFVSAASPGREAWDRYFDSMEEQGQSAWNTRHWFDRDLERSS